MSLTPSTVAAIKALIAQDAALLERLTQAADAASAARLTADAATSQGLDVQVAQIEAYFAQQMQHANEISDDALDAVTGGVSNSPQGPANRPVMQRIHAFGVA